MTKILVIEDDPPILDNILDTMEAEGYEVQGAEHGLAGLELAHVFQPDLIICDILMPKLDGYGILQELQEDPKMSSVPFIFLTARTERGDLRKGMDMGADDYITKPFTRSELLSAVETRLRKQSVVSELQESYVQVSESDQLKSDMIRMAAHDLRNPITTVSMSLYALRLAHGEQLSQEVLEKLDMIETASGRMEHIARDILSLARIEETMQHRNLEPIDLNAIVTESYDNHLAQAQQNRQALNLEPAPTPPIFQGDPEQVSHAIDNLIGNALKYTPDGGRVDVRTQCGKGKVRFSVTDNGYGIPADKQSRLFEPFYRAQTEETRDIQGTGLGLHLVKKIIERHSGTMFFRSVVGKGSIFGFELSLVLTGIVCD